MGSSKDGGDGGGGGKGDGKDDDTIVCVFATRGDGTLSSIPKECVPRLRPIHCHGINFNKYNDDEQTNKTKPTKSNGMTHVSTPGFEPQPNGHVREG